jgi:serine phosphatase RsbU (regulator of sigma subunit)
MELYVGVAKAPKFGFSESGDTVEIVERPRGGLTCVMADGQGHGRAAKRTSTMVVNKTVSLVADGARDGAAARAAHDFLYALRDGKVSATLALVSVDLRTKTLVISRNSHCPVYLRRGREGSVERLTGDVEPIGVHEVMKPSITEIPLELESVVVTFTDGVLTSGARYDRRLDLDQVGSMVAAADARSVHQLADSLLDLAHRLDDGRPADDMSVLAVGLSADSGGERIRRLSMSIPF